MKPQGREATGQAKMGQHLRRALGIYWWAASSAPGPLVTGNFLLWVLPAVRGLAQFGFLRHMNLENLVIVGV